MHIYHTSHSQWKQILKSTIITDIFSWLCWHKRITCINYTDDEYVYMYILKLEKWWWVQISWNLSKNFHFEQHIIYVYNIKVGNMSIIMKLVFTYMWHITHSQSLVINCPSCIVAAETFSHPGLKSQSKKKKKSHHKRLPTLW